MRVLAVEAVGQFIGLGFADHVSTGGQQLRNHRCSLCSGIMRCQPVRTAEAGLVAGDVVYILDAESQPRERARA